ncbi:unnamed protein product, partial [marine sediment metagenome]
ALMIVFSAVGCKTIPPAENVKWLMPKKPEKYTVVSVPIYKNQPFTPEQNGIFIDEESANNLLLNIDGLDAYIQKQEKLIQEMKRYYNANKIGVIK